MPVVQAAAPPQGVFVQSNNEDKNEVGSYKILEDGSLDWVGKFDTGGVGFPAQPTTGFAAWTSANCLSWHVWNNQQWLLASSMGGEEAEGSISIFKVNHEDLTLNLTDTKDVFDDPDEFAWANSVTGFEDRACVLGGGTNVLLECFKIDTEGKLTLEFSHDFALTIDEAVTLRGHSGTASVQFSPDGTYLGVLHKGSVDVIFPLSRTPSENVPEVLHNASFAVFDVLNGGTDGRYGEVREHEIWAYRRPYDFVWAPTSDRIFTVGVPTGVNFTTERANTITIDVTDTGFNEVGLYQWGIQASCWVEYYDANVYTSNFMQQHDVNIIPVIEDGSLDVAARIDRELGNMTGPLDLSISGKNEDGERFMYIQLAGQSAIGVYGFADNGNLTDVGNYTVPGDSEGTSTWNFYAGVAATTMSSAEMNEIFGTPETSGGTVLLARVAMVVMAVAALVV